MKGILIINSVESNHPKETANHTIFSSKGQGRQAGALDSLLRVVKLNLPSSHTKVVGYNNSFLRKPPHQEQKTRIRSQPDVVAYNHSQQEHFAGDFKVVDILEASPKDVSAKPVNLR